MLQPCVSMDICLYPLLIVYGLRFHINKVRYGASTCSSFRLAVQTVLQLEQTLAVASLICHLHLISHISSC